MRGRRRYWAALLAIAAFSAALQLGLPRGYQADLADFQSWSDSWANGPAALYRDSGCNYPALGAIATAGAFALIRGAVPDLGSAEQRGVFQSLLVFWDLADTLLVFGLLLALSVPNPLGWAVVIHLLPSSWAGGALWGQIDGITQFFVLVSALGFLRAIRALSAGGGRSEGWLPSYALGAVGAAGGLLTKQLFILSLPGLASLWLCATLLAWRSGGARGAARAIGTTAGAAALLFAPDLYFRSARGHFSHLAHVLLDGGSDHGEWIAGNGFNIWVLLGRNMWSSSNAPFYESLTPKLTGRFLYVAYLAVAWLPLLASLARRRTWERPLAVASWLVLALALGNLAFNVFMTGTHERYLFHFYPFLLAGLLALRAQGAALGRGWIAAALGMATAYGAFVYRVLDTGWETPLHLIWGNAAFLASAHLILLLALTTLFLSQVLPAALRAR